MTRLTAYAKEIWHYYKDNKESFVVLCMEDNHDII